MSAYSLDPDAPFAVTYADAQRRILLDREAGGDRRHDAARHEQRLAEHLPTPRETGQPCDSCGARWPCWAIEWILTPE